MRRTKARTLKLYHEKFGRTREVSKDSWEVISEGGMYLKLGKEYIKDVYCHLAYLTYISVHHVKCWAGVNQKLESRFQGEISTTSDMQMISF